MKTKLIFTGTILLAGITSSPALAADSLYISGNIGISQFSDIGQTPQHRSSMAVSLPNQVCMLRVRSASISTVSGLMRNSVIRETMRTRYPCMEWSPSVIQNV